MNPLWKILPLVGTLVASGFGSPAGVSGAKRLAVLEIENTTGQYESFTQGLPDMLVTELVRRTGEQLVERSRIQAAMKELKLEGYGFTSESGQRIGRWVGADRALLGSFMQIGTVFRIDARVIDVESGDIQCAAQSSVRGGELLPLVGSLVTELSTCLSPQPTAPASNRHPVQDPLLSAGTGDYTEAQVHAATAHLTIRHRIVLSLFTEKSVPRQRIRVWIDGKLAGESSDIDAVGRDFTVFDGNIPRNARIIRLEHGVIGKDGNWKRDLEIQPEEILLDRTWASMVVEYRMKVSAVDFRFQEYRWQ